MIGQLFEHDCDLLSLRKLSDIDDLNNGCLYSGFHTSNPDICNSSTTQLVEPFVTK